jgi:hypothetical protein
MPYIIKQTFQRKASDTQLIRYLSGYVNGVSLWENKEKAQQFDYRFEAANMARKFKHCKIEKI